jgi:hypothetical protein
LGKVILAWHGVCLVVVNEILVLRSISNEFKLLDVLKNCAVWVINCKSVGLGLVIEVLQGNLEIFSFAWNHSQLGTV